MAKAFLYSVSLDNPRISEWMRGAYLLFSESSRIDSFGVHCTTNDPEEADIIIFTELGCHGLFAERVRHHPLVARFRNKCFLFDTGDYALPFLPGLYASLCKRYDDKTRTRTGCYLRIDENPYVTFRPAQRHYPYVATFVGSTVNDPVRRELARLSHPCILIEDTSSFALKMLHGGEVDARQRFWRHYADTIASAPFALCPRGRGAGSVRLFEVMQMGRVPVIISDDWIYPARVDWQTCSITVRENDVRRIPKILDQYRDRALEMGLRARKEWESYYAPNVRFHWLVEDCLALLRARQLPETIAGRLVWRHLLDYRTFRRYLTSKKQIYHETGRVLL